MNAQYTDDGRVSVSLDAGETLAHVEGPADLVLMPTPGLILWDALVAANVVVAPHAGAQLNFLGFMALFTSAEQAAIVGSADPRVKLFCLMAAGASFVDLADPRVVSGAQLLESLALIGAGRAAQVLAGQTPRAS